MDADAISQEWGHCRRGYQSLTFGVEGINPSHSDRKEEWVRPSSGSVNTASVAVDVCNKRKEVMVTSTSCSAGELVELMAAGRGKPAWMVLRAVDLVVDFERRLPGEVNEYPSVGCDVGTRCCRGSEKGVDLWYVMSEVKG
jgi:hypothetical protein